MFDLAAIQKSLREFGLDGWLLYDFRASNVLARRVLDLEAKPAGSRRFFYMIPGHGRARPSWSTASRPPRSISLPGGKTIYLPWQELEAGIGHLVCGQADGWRWSTRPRVSNPYVSKVDAGTVEVVRSLRRRGRLLGRPDPAVRGHLGRRPVAMHREAETLHDVGLSTWPGA